MGSLRMLGNKIKMKHKFTNSIRYIWPKSIKIGLIHNGQLCYSKDRDVTPMTILHKMRNIFI